jgi:hypothetical protein
MILITGATGVIGRESEAGPTTDTVRRLPGRPARTYATWANGHRPAFTAGGHR